MALPTLEYKKDKCEIKLDKNGIVLISITVCRTYLDRELWKNGTAHIKCWKICSCYKKIAKEMHKIICDYIRSSNMKFRREDFSKIDFKELSQYSKYQDAITSW